MGRVGLSFHWDAFGIEGMVEEKMVSVDFGGAAGFKLLTPSARARPTRLGLQNRVPGVCRPAHWVQTHAVGSVDPA
jgi:hypothetical protein